jgi:hypothetical protein
MRCAECRRPLLHRRHHRLLRRSHHSNTKAGCHLLPTLSIKMAEARTILCRHQVLLRPFHRKGSRGTRRCHRLLRDIMDQVLQCLRIQVSSPSPRHITDRLVIAAKGHRRLRHSRTTARRHHHRTSPCRLLPLRGLAETLLPFNLRIFLRLVPALLALLRTNRTIRSGKRFVTNNNACYYCDMPHGVNTKQANAPLQRIARV